MVGNAPDILMKPRKIPFISFFILLFSLVFIVSLAKFGVSISPVSILYFLFFESTILFCVTAVIVVRRRSMKF